MITEIWKKIPGYKYTISNQGRLQSHHHRKKTIIKPIGKKERYLSYFICKNGTIKKKKCHRLVAEYFIGKCPKGYEVNHIDGNKKNNHVINLEYITKSENQKHAIRLGLRKVLHGADLNTSILSDKKVIDIRKKYTQGFSQNMLAKQYNVRQSTIWYILHRITWKHI